MSHRTRELFFVSAVLAGALGWWLPYVRHHNGAAALVLLGLDLGDFWKFTNEWKSDGLFAVERLFFYLPPALAANMLALWLATKRGAWRLIFLPLLVFLAFVILPAIDVMLPELLPGNPFIFEESALSREFGFQLRLSIATVLVVIATPLMQWLPGRILRVMLAILGLLGAILPSYALWYTWSMLQVYYGGDAVVGAGSLLTGLGFGLAGCLAVFMTAQAPPPPTG